MFWNKFLLIYKFYWVHFDLNTDMLLNYIIRNKFILLLYLFLTFKFSFKTEVCDSILKRKLICLQNIFGVCKSVSFC